jgi:hypothetical protein
MYILPSSLNKSIIKVILCQRFVSLTKFIEKSYKIYDTKSIIRYTIKYIFMIC